MKTLLAAVILAASSIVSPAAIMLASPAAALTCGDDVPAGWKRPGGYCDRIENPESLARPDDCVPFQDLIVYRPGYAGAAELQLAAAECGSNVYMDPQSI